ncbi:hypothetical protein LP420_34720 [Massilia sp. B-10]|nr:hypothetical protein LP420_34720 [Massilia sp. B-10]
MRERWKALDTLSGAAPKSLWERFDAACSAAYAAKPRPTSSIWPTSATPTPPRPRP